MNSVTSIISSMTIRQRKNGLYEGRISNDGIRKSFYGYTKAEIKNKAKSYLMKVENGFSEPKKILLSDYIEYWLKTYKLNKIEPPSYYRLYSVYEHQLKDTIGLKMMGDIKARDIQNFIDEMANPSNGKIKPLAISGLKKIIQLLNPCFKTAIQEGILFLNPCDGVTLPKESCIKTPTKKQISLSDDEIEKFKEVALEKYKSTAEYCSRDFLVLLLIVNLGLRVGEMLALSWSDIDFENHIVYINKTLQSDIRNFEAKEGEKKLYSRIKNSTKTNAGMRVISLNDSVMSYLEELRAYDKRNNIVSDYVACTTAGTLNRARNLQRSLERLLKKANIDKKVSLHTLRHTFGSYLLRKGVGIEVISKLMGHARITVTYNKYIHTIKEEEAKAMNMIRIC
ncbi:MAG: tyrosine-type recombinase/integrase [Catonella sp.]|uniref:tyrosine-type recombinase/integrase n=1 Tax=Catonella sp. TaxID=2382125 RepID=UPI003FA07CA6